MELILMISSVYIFQFPCLGQWTLIYEPPGIIDVKDIEINKEGDIFLAGDGNIYKSNTGGVSWESIYSGIYDIRSLKFLDTDTGYAAKANGDGIGINLRTYDGGATWDVPTTFSEYWADNNDLVVLSGKSVMLVGGLNVGYIQISDNFLESVELKYPDPLGKSFAAIDCVNNDTCISIPGDPYGFHDELGSILMTKDHGQNWIEKGIVNLGRDIVFTSKEVIYVLGAFDLLRSKDSGESFESIKTTDLLNYGEFQAIKFLNDSIGYLGEKFNGLDSVAIYFTSNGGLSWTLTEIDLLPSSIASIDCIDEKYCFFASINGNFFRTTNGGFNSILQSNPIVETISVYPNPAINSLKIISQNMGLLYSIDTYNLLGEKIELVFNNDYVADVNSLPSGLYFTEVRTNTSKEIVKWVKQ